MYKPLLIAPLLGLVLLLSFSKTSVAQISMPGSKPSSGLGQGSDEEGNPAQRQKLYELGPIVVVGAHYLDEDLLLAVAGLTVGSKVRLPGDEAISRAIRNLWKQDLFGDVRIDVTKIVGDKAFLTITVEEKPRMSKFNFKGVKKSEATELKTKIDAMQSRVATEATKKGSACADTPNTLRTKATAV